MALWASVGAADLLQDGMLRAVEVEGRTILLARIAGAYYATQERCPHLGWHLARGRLQGNVLTCAGHGSQFDLITGKNLAWVEGLGGIVKSVAQALSKPKNLITYPVKIEAGQVWVQI
jgi:nitrite reductase/ring-hydroxylating ferredoxin subunit